MEELDRRIGGARALMAERRWGEAALAWVHSAQRCDTLDHPDAQRQCWDAAGECWRRDDHPAAAARALRRALHLASGRVELASLSRVKLAGVLGELGNSEAAAQLARTAAADIPEGPVHLMAVDTLVGALLGLGQVDAIVPLVAELAGIEEGPMAAAGLFRSGQLSRLRGRLDLATEDFALVIIELEDHPHAGAGVAAAEAELGQLAALKGELDDALSLYERSILRHREAGRRALAWRAEAGRIRVVVASGVQPLVHGLDEGIGLAHERGMVMLEVDLRLARGVARSRSEPQAAEADLRQAIRLADAHAAPLRAGRARYELGSRLPVSDAVGLLQQGALQLQDDEPWLQRARLALGYLLLPSEPRRGKELMLSALAHLEAMGMGRDAQRARDLLREVP